MRRTSMIVLALALAMGCQRPSDAPAAQGYPQAQGYPPAQYPPPGYYPPPPGYYPPPQPTYAPPPPQAQPQPQPPPQPAPSPPPQPSQPSQPSPPSYNPWLTMLGNLLNGGAPPAPPPQPGPQPPAPAPAPTTPPAPPAPPAISARALDLANAINGYRAENGLPPIPISRSLSLVAETHVRDLHDSPKVPTTCNGHSWSSKGPWTPCCYTPDHAQAKCMWHKPAELTQFKGTGFEITIGQPGEHSAGLVLDSPKAIAAWKGSPLHNDVLLNRGTWQKMTWKAMGAGIIDSHACAWFSDQADPTP